MKIYLSISMFFLLCTTLCATAQEAQHYPQAAVVSAHPEATHVGVSIMKAGGNAVDAAVAVQFALAVVYPNAGNIGGGGFLVYRSKEGQINSLDYRETAPAAATKDMYLDAKGNAITDKSLFGALASGVPGTVDGMVRLHRKYARLPWKTVLQPAIELAEKGFPITRQQADELNARKSQFLNYNKRSVAFTKDSLWLAGDLLIQSELARTLKLIRDKGRAGFYSGTLANAIVQSMAHTGGIISKDDLKNYRSVWRKPLSGNYKDYRIISMPAPSSGGIALLTLLKQAEQYPLSRWGFQKDSTVQVMVEAERRAYADRASYLGDPDYFKVPQKALLDTTYMKSRIRDMSFSAATPSSAVKAGQLPYESEQTTHYSIVDTEGNAVAATTTLNGSYGSMVVVEGAGFLLNNEMDDFSVKPGVANMYGLVGGLANAIAPGKRMLSSMTPTIVEKGGKLLMVVGTPGGSTIITSVYQTILNVLAFGMDMQSAVAAPRFHHQWLPDEVAFEQGAIDEPTKQRLTAKGYRFTARGPIGRVDAILVKPGGILETGADPRGNDTASGF
ncbi:gamma-glutamyltransferase [Pedobacter sp. GR22-6]|uniref:gamma-glutamyltransferase n=1 Tax=Pedobacter sp. GR22-6 TaxID=3127957 RepID=UPI00307EE946